MLRYVVTASMLGAGWFPVLLIPGMTRTWLLASAWQSLACLVAASVIVAVACRRTIERADSLGAHLTRAAVVPYAGCLVFLTLWAGLLWIRTLLFGGLANLHDTVSLYVMGMAAAVLSCLVVVPYGLLCQYAMNAASRAWDSGGV